MGCTSSRSSTALTYGLATCRPSSTGCSGLSKPRRSRWSACRASCPPSRALRASTCSSAGMPSALTASLCSCFAEEKQAMPGLCESASPRTPSSCLEQCLYTSQLQQSVRGWQCCVHSCLLPPELPTDSVVLCAGSRRCRGPHRCGHWKLNSPPLQIGGSLGCLTRATTPPSSASLSSWITLTMGQDCPRLTAANSVCQACVCCRSCMPGWQRLQASILCSSAAPC